MKAKTLWKQDGSGKCATLKQIATSMAARKKDYVIARWIYEEAKMNAVR